MLEFHARIDTRCSAFVVITLLNCMLPTSVTLAADPLDQPLPDVGTRRIGEDWPRFLGPTSDSKSTEVGVSAWPGNGPRQVWVRSLSESYGIGSVARGRYFQFDYENGFAKVICLLSETGRELWQFRYRSDYKDLYGYNSGPRCSPVIDGHRLYVYGVEGMLHCLDARKGDVRWKVDVNQRFGVIKNFFGVGSTPVIHGDLLIVMVGGSPLDDQHLPPGQLDRVNGNGTGLVAFDKRTGQVRYKLSDDLASYASPQLARNGARNWCFALMRSGLVAFDPDTGQQDFEFRWRAKLLESVNASCPVIVEDKVFISETYGPGSALLKFRPGGYETIWKDDARRRDKSMQAHWNTPIYHDGYLYGCSGRHTHNADLRCIEFETGRVMWRQAGLTRSSLLFVDRHLVCLSEDGTLRLIKANPKRYELVSQVRLIRADPSDVSEPNRPLIAYPAWSAPILSHGLLYIRGKDRLACLELIPDSN